MARRNVVILLVIGCAIGGLFPFLNKGTSELPVYVAGAVRMLAEQEVYRPAEAKAFTYPPFFALPFVPWTWIEGEKLQRGAWYFANLGMLVTLFWVLHRVVRDVVPQGRARVWLWAIALAVSLRHVLAVFQNQSHDLVIALSVAFAASSLGRGRSLLSGAWAGVGAACKATPLLFVWPFLLRRDWRALVGVGVAVLACTLLPDLLFPREDGRLWGVAYYEIMLRGIDVGGAAAKQGVWNAGSILNQSLSGTIHRLTTPLEPGLRILDVAPVHLDDGVRKAVTVGAQLLVVALIGLAAWPRKRSPRDVGLHGLGIASAVACGMVLLSPMSSKSHFCVLILPAIHGAATLWRRRDPVVMALLAGAFVVGTLTSKGVVGKANGEYVLACGAVTWSAALLLASSAHAVFWAPRVEAVVCPAGEAATP